MVNKIEEGRSNPRWKERISAITGGDIPGLHKTIQNGTTTIDISRFKDDIFLGWEIEISDNSTMVVIYDLYDNNGLVEINIPDESSSEGPGLSRDFFDKSKKGGLTRYFDGTFYFLADETDDGELENQTTAIVSYLEEQIAKTVSP